MSGAAATGPTQVPPGTTDVGNTSPTRVKWRDWNRRVAKVKAGDTAAIADLQALGKGGFSDGVFHIERKRRLGKDEEFAVKLSVNSEDQPTAVETLLHEVQFTQELDHENIRKVRSRVHVNRSGDVATALFEYVQGVDLYELTEQSLFPRTPPTTGLNAIAAYPGAVFVIMKVLRALQYLHSLGIVYNDMKPENVLVGATSLLGIYESTPVKLIDMGLAFRLGSEDAFKIRGSRDWMSPESFPQPGKPQVAKTCASDVFSFGLVIYALFTGRPLIVWKDYEGNSSRHYVKLCARRAHDVLLELDNMLVFSNIKELVMGCLSQRPQLRPTVSMILQLEMFTNPPPLRTCSMPELSAGTPLEGSRPEPRAARTRDST